MRAQEAPCWAAPLIKTCVVVLHDRLNFSNTRPALGGAVEPSCTFLPMAGRPKGRVSLALPLW